MFTSGFFNSVNGDRRYNAEQMSAIFDGLITDGIFDTIGDHFQVTPGNGLSVSVGTGRAWLNQTWSYNDSLYPIELSAASPTLGRKDLICLKVDKSTANRTNSIALIEGTPASTPTEPTVSDDTTNGIYYHKLAAVTVPAGATSISAANIYNYIGLSTGTPYVTGIVETTAVDELWSQWDGEFNDWWENSIKPIINTETVTRLQNNIDRITPKEATMNLYGFSHINPPPSGKTYQEYSTDAILNQINTLLSQKANSSDLSSYVPTSRTVNGKALSSNISLTASDINAVPTSRTVNGKALSSNITIDAKSVNAFTFEMGSYTGTDSTDAWDLTFSKSYNYPYIFNIEYYTSTTSSSNIIPGGNSNAPGWWNGFIYIVSVSIKTSALWTTSGSPRALSNIRGYNGKMAFVSSVAYPNYNCNDSSATYRWTVIGVPK